MWQADKTPGFLEGWLVVFLTFEVERERCCKVHKPFELWPLVSKWSYSESLWQSRGMLLTERGTVLISSSLWERPGTVIDSTSFESDAILPLWRRKGEGSHLNILCDTPASSGRQLQVSGAWWKFGVLNWDWKGDSERCSVLCPRWNEETFERISELERKNNRLLDLYFSCSPLSWEGSLHNGAPPSENESGEQNGLMNSNLSWSGKCLLSWGTRNRRL